MKQKNKQEFSYLQALLLSFFSRRLYQDVARNWSKSGHYFTLKFATYLAILLIVSILITIFNLNPEQYIKSISTTLLGDGRFITKEKALYRDVYILSSIPQMEYKNQKLHTKKADVFVITDPIAGKAFMTINTENKKAIDDNWASKPHGAQGDNCVGYDNFQKENPNIKVILQNQSSYPDLQQKITATTASPKDLPTMTQAYPDWLLNAIDENLVLDLKPYIENETLKFDNYDDIVKGFREASTLDGKIYGIPFNKSTEVLWYNKTLFDKLNLKVPKTYEEFKDVAEDIKEKANIRLHNIKSKTYIYE